MEQKLHPLFLLDHITPHSITFHHFLRAEGIIILVLVSLSEHGGHVLGAVRHRSGDRRRGKMSQCE